MSVSISYSNGVIDALEKVAEGMTMEQARSYVANKSKEHKQDSLFTGIGGIGLGAAEGIADVTPISGKMMVLPGAVAGYATSKLKNVFDSPSEMYKRDGSYTGRTYGGVAGGLAGAGLGAGIGSLIDDSGWGLGIGSVLGSLLGSAAGQDIGDYATERRNADVIRKAKIEAARRKKFLQQKYK